MSYAQAAQSLSEVEVPVSLLLPPNVSEKNLSKALADFATVVGAEHVLTSEEGKAEFRDPFWFKSWDDYEAAAVVQPGTVEEIQAIVRIANERHVPLWVSAVGRNNGYGGSSPRVRGSVVVNLRRMNRVLEINEELGYAVVEPGVTWFDLYDAIQSGGHKLRLSVADLGWGSVVGNTLDHGITYLPYGQDQMMQCGMEVVLPGGELMRTGNWAIPNSKAAHVYKRGLGPTPDQLFMQSNFGIVTKMGVWLLPTPECYMPCWLRVWKDSDLPQVVETLRGLMLDKSIEGVPQVLNTLCLASVFSNRKQWYDGDDPMPDDMIDHVAKELDIGRWIMRFAMYGDENMVDLKFAKVKKAFEQIEGAEVWGTKYGADEYDKITHPAEKVEIGIPNLDINTMTGWYGGEEGGHVAFSPAVPMTRQACRRGLRAAPRPHREEGQPRLPRGAPADQRALLHSHHDGHLRHEGRAAGARRVRDLRSCSCGRRPSRATANTGPISTSWTSPRISTRSTTMPTGASRDDQGRARPERDPNARPARHLAEVHAPRAR